MLTSLATLYDKRWLAWYFVQRQLSRNYRSSYLGFLWAFLSPLFMIALYTLIFSEILGIRFREVEGDSTLNFGLYLYCGLIPFLAFSDALTSATNSIRSNAALVQKVVFPLEVLPLTTAIAALVDKLFGLGVLLGVLTLLGRPPEWTVLLLVPLLAVQMLFTLGLSYLFAVIGTYVPDVRETLRAFVRGLFFATPIIWPPERVPESLSFIVDYNPLAFLVMAYRDLVLEGQLPPLSGTLWFSALAAALFVAGFAIFSKTKLRFADLL